MPRKKTARAQSTVKQQASFDDVDIMTIPGVTEETVADLSEDLDTFFETKEAVSRNRKAARAIKSVIPDVGKATRFRIDNKGIVEATPRDREPYSVKAGRIVGKAIKRIE